MAKRDPLRFVQEQLAELRGQDMFRTLRRVEGAQGPHMRVDGKDVTCFCSNNYLDLANDPRVVESACKAARRFGWGAGASRLVSGNMRLHEELETRLCAFERSEAALVFPTGFMANLGVLAALADRSDLIVGDKRNHASLIDGCRLSGAHFRTYRHNDYKAIMRRLQHGADRRRKLVVTDSVFSMDGDLAPLEDIQAICEAFDAILVVDEAHATGVLGERGTGACEHFGVHDKVPVRVITLSKALASVGGVVLGSRSLIEYLRNRARPFIYTTGLPPACAAAAITALDILEREPERLKRLWQNIAALSDGLMVRRLISRPLQSAIAPVVIGEPAQALRVAQLLEDRGILAPAIRPPTVAPGTSRLRISLSAGHTADDIEKLLLALEDAYRLFPWPKEETND